MWKFHSHRIGVDQGAQVLFSDFANNGEMWIGEGPRERVTPVSFSEPFISIPAVHVSLDMWDMDQKTNQRADVSARNITRTGFDIVFRT